MIARHLIISGVVQGVGYRAWFEQAARSLRLSGWVRNRRNSTVEAVIAGDLPAVEQMAIWARSGPPAARVDHVAVAEVDFDTATFTPDQFAILATQ